MTTEQIVMTHQEKFQWIIDIKKQIPNGLNPSQLPSELAKVWPTSMFPICMTHRSRRADDGFIHQGNLSLDCSREPSQLEKMSAELMMKDLKPAAHSGSPTSKDIEYGLYKASVGRLVWIEDKQEHWYYSGKGHWRDSAKEVKMIVESRFWLDTESSDGERVEQAS